MAISTWRSNFESKLVSPETALSAIGRGCRVFVSLGDEPLTLLAALAGRSGEISGVEIIAQNPLYPQVWYEEGFAESFLGSVETSTGGVSRAALDGRIADYYPTLFSRSYKAILERPSEAQSIDVFLVSVTPPDSAGYCSFGTRAWRKRSLVDHAGITIAELDENLPRVGSRNRLHVSEVAYFVEKLVPAEQPPAPPIPDEAWPIGTLTAELIHDGDTVQIGYGTTSAALIQTGLLDGKHDLGWHSEMTPYGVLDALQRGVITNARKTINRGKLVTTSLYAQPHERHFIEGNPVIDVRDVSYVNDISVIAAHDNLVAINNALATDLTGQIAAEGIGPSVWSGIGGQPEFAIGALLSKGGRYITVLPSQTSAGISRICAQLPQGTNVSIPRYLADTVVTEWGIARLLGKSQRQRAQELIAIAHPDHRAELRRAAQKLFWP